MTVSLAPRFRVARRTAADAAAAGTATVLIRPTEGEVVSFNADQTLTLRHARTGATFTAEKTEVLDVL